MSNWFKKLFGCKGDCCCHKGEDCCHNKEEKKNEEAAVSTPTPEAGSETVVSSPEAPVVNNNEAPKTE